MREKQVKKLRKKSHDYICCREFFLNFFTRFSHIFHLRFHGGFHIVFFFTPSPPLGLPVFFWVGMSFRSLGGVWLALRWEVLLASAAIGALEWMWCGRPGNRIAGRSSCFCVRMGPGAAAYVAICPTNLH